MSNIHGKASGFGIAGILIVLAVLISIGGIGYYVYAKNSSGSSASADQESKSEAENKADSPSGTEKSTETPKVESYKSVISFKDDGSLTETQKAEIRVRLAEPLSFYHFNNLNIPLKEVTIQKAEAQGYTLSYVYVDSPETNKFGFVFNPESVKFWQPQLCDHGGCSPYPESLKKAYPANFQAYEACQDAEGDKEKQSSLGCDYTS